MGMQERLRLVNGEFAIISAPGKGTVIRALIPFRAGKRGVLPNRKTVS